jgi:hypothetical protein
MARLRLITVAALAVSVLCGCGSGGESQQSGPANGGDASAGAPSTGSSSVAQSAQADTSSPLAKPPHGVILARSDGNVCELGSFDLEKQEVTLFAGFDFGQFSAECPTVGAVALSPDFLRLAHRQMVNGEERAGWLDASGGFTPIGPPSQQPDFGRSSEVHAIGFDKLGNFYYSLTDPDSDPFHETGEIYRVPAGEESDGKLIGAFGGSDERDLIPTNEGTLELGEVPVEMVSCRIDTDGMTGRPSRDNIYYDGPYDPDRQVYFYEYVGQIFRISEISCDPDSGTPITPAVNTGILTFTSNADRSQVVFCTGGSKCYVVDGKGQGAPTEIGGGADLLNWSASIIGWR